MFTSKMYRASPVIIQELMINLRSMLRKNLRERRRFHSYYEDIKNHEHLDCNALTELQLAKLRNVISVARQYVPFYSSLFYELGISEFDMQSIEDIKALPVMTKEIVRTNQENLINKRKHWPIFKSDTSGTTGTPLTIYQDLEAIIRENAFIWRQLHWAGYQNGHRRVWIRGDMVAPVQQKNTPYWRRDISSRMLMMSSYHLSETNSPYYIRAIEEWDPMLIQAYPSSIAYLAQHLCNHGKRYKGKFLKGIVTSSETLSSKQRDLIEEYFGTKVFDWYGNAERVVAIGTCEHGSYHVMSDYGLTEFVKCNNGTHEIISTGFNNLVMPLIRYKTGDSVDIDRKLQSCPCGRSFPVVDKILGRMDDCIKTPDGRKVGRLDHIFKGVNNVIEAQIIQNSIDKILIKVVPAKGYTDIDKHIISKNGKERIGEEVELIIEEVESIPRSKNGKLRFVVCNV